MGLRKEKSCGCIIIKDNKVLLIYEKTAQYLGFPKGHMENEESEIETAIREVKEEIGLDVEIEIDKRYVLNYVIDSKINKETVLYKATPKNEEIVTQENEIEKTEWCDFNKALDMLNFDNLKEVFKRVVEDIETNN